MNFVLTLLSLACRRTSIDFLEVIDVEPHDARYPGGKNSKNTSGLKAASDCLPISAPPLSNGFRGSDVALE